MDWANHPPLPFTPGSSGYPAFRKVRGLVGLLGGKAERGEACKEEEAPGKNLQPLTVVRGQADVGGHFRCPKQLPKRSNSKLEFNHFLNKTTKKQMMLMFHDGYSK